MAQKKTKIFLWALVAVLVAVAVFIILQLQCGKALVEEDGRLDIEHRGPDAGDVVDDAVKPRVGKTVPAKKSAPVTAVVKKSVRKTREKTDAIISNEGKEDTKAKQTKKKKKKGDFEDQPVDNVPSF